MSIDALQAKIKKTDNALMVDFSLDPERLPPAEGEQSLCDRYQDYCLRLLTGLRSKVPAVRFRLLPFALLGGGGVEALSALLNKAASLGFYTLLDVYGVSSASLAKFAASQIWGEKTRLPCDGLLISGYFGTELIRPFLPYCEEQKKDLFLAVRSVNKSASEIQDLLVGSRMVHMAAADYVNRFAATTVGKYGYARIGIAASATMGDSIKMLRASYPKLFILVDGMDVSGANAKNASQGFNALGHGAICCVGSSVTCAWQQEEYARMDTVEAAVAAVEKTQKKINRYISLR